MHLLDRIETQLISNRLPLVAISVAAVPYANTPVVLTLHWHGFVETRLAERADAAGRHRDVTAIDALAAAVEASGAGQGSLGHGMSDGRGDLVRR